MFACDQELYGVAPHRERVGELDRVVEEATERQRFDDGYPHRERWGLGPIVGQPLLTEPFPA